MPEDAAPAALRGLVRAIRAGHRGCSATRSHAGVTPSIRLCDVEGHDGDGHPRAMRCTGCGAQAPFDPELPYVNQTASFAVAHACRRRPLLAVSGRR